jgi:sec-independent protein translocase protein TatB
MLSIPHLIVIFIVVLVVFGPEKLPELARNFGKVMAEFRRATGDLRSTFESHMRDLEREAEDRRIGPDRAAATLPSAPPQPTAPSAPVPTGTVTANAPHVAAVAPPETGSEAPSDNAERLDMAPGHHPAVSPAQEASPPPSYDVPGHRAHEPMHDPYLDAIEADLAAAQLPAPKPQSPESETAPEKNSERVSDVRNLPA